MMRPRYIVIPLALVVAAFVPNDSLKIDTPVNKAEPVSTVVSPQAVTLAEHHRRTVVSRDRVPDAIPGPIMATEMTQIRRVVVSQRIKAVRLHKAKLRAAKAARAAARAAKAAAQAEAARAEAAKVEAVKAEAAKKVVSPPPVATSVSGYTGIAVRIATCESGGLPGGVRAQNPTSTASGLYQFIDGTWTGITGLAPPASAYSVATQTTAFWKLWNNGAGAGNWISSRACWG